jgi:hypothetical protein
MLACVSKRLIRQALTAPVVSRSFFVAEHQTDNSGQVSAENASDFHILRPEDLPSEGAAYEKIAPAACSNLQQTDCYFISNSHAGVPVYNYGEPYGALYNPHLIAGYLTLLLDDAYKHSNRGGGTLFCTQDSRLAGNRPQITTSGPRCLARQRPSGGREARGRNGPVANRKELPPTRAI